MGRMILGLAVASALAPMAWTQVVCVPSSALIPVRAEGLTEVVGDIAVTCSGPVGAPVTGSLTVFLSVNVTNRLSGTGTLDAVLVANEASIPGVVAKPAGSNGVAFDNLNLTIPPSGTLQFRATNLRAAIAQQGLNNKTFIEAFLGFTGHGGLTLTSQRVLVAYPQRGLLAGANSTSATCYGSPVPDQITLSALFAAGTKVFSGRATEGFAEAFQKAGPGATGTRIVVRYKNMPEGTRLFVPDVIAGSTALEQTSGGDLNLSKAAGRYAPTTTGSLLLSLVEGADVNGAGGEVVYTPEAPGGAPVQLDAAREVKLTGGNGVAVYEVMDAQPGRQENAHLPTFFGFPPTDGGMITTTKQEILLGPVSEVGIVSATAPVPRFVEAEPELDCTSLGDCSTFPKLFVNITKPFSFFSVLGGRRQSEFASVENHGGGYLSWSAAFVYKTGAGWASLYAEPNVGDRPGWFRVDVDPKGLPPGRYEAVLHIDAGVFAGTADVPITMDVVVPVAPTVHAVVNAASFAPGPVVAGSIASLFGVALGGSQVQVTFDGIPAQVFYAGATQINLLVPAELGTRPSATLMVTADRVSSAATPVQLAVMNPAVFGGGVLNQDYSVNSATNPALAGSVLQVFATGLPSPELGVTEVRLGGSEAAVEYAGQAPGFAGLWQVNVRIPADAPAGPMKLLLCGRSRISFGEVCGPEVTVAVRR